MANVVANPFDVMKSLCKVCLSMPGGKSMYNSMGDCSAKSVKSEGIFVLWRGFTPAFVKLIDIMLSLFKSSYF